MGERARDASRARAEVAENRGGFKLSYRKIVKLACFQAIWAAFMSPIPRMAMAGLGGGVDVDFRSPAVTAPDS